MAPQEHEAGLAVQGMTVVPITPRMRKRKTDTSFPTEQQVLNLAASKYLTTIEPSRPEDLNGLVYFLEKIRKLLIVDTQSGSLIITLECSSLEMLDELWNDYCHGFLNKMAQKFLVTDEVLKGLGLTEVKLTTTILQDDYRACREYLLRHSGEFRSLVYLQVYCSPFFLVPKAIPLFIRLLSNAFFFYFGSVCRKKKKTAKIKLDKESGARRPGTSA